MLALGAFPARQQFSSQGGHACHGKVAIDPAMSSLCVDASYLQHIAAEGLCGDLLPAAAAMLDDFTVVGYGEWESRKALESHLQKGAESQHRAAVTPCMLLLLLLRLVQSLYVQFIPSAGSCAHYLLYGDQSSALLAVRKLITHLSLLCRLLPGVQAGPPEA